jgi:hypothetical protein
VSTEYRVLADLIEAIESTRNGTREAAAQALSLVRDGIITGEGPTTKGRAHFSRELDAADAAWCRRILMAEGLAQSPVSRAEVETLFQIDEAASERTDDGEFDDLFVKAVVHHAAAASGAKVPPRAVALSPETAIESWAPNAAADIDTKVLEWIAGQMRGQRHQNRTLVALIATLIGAAALPLAQALPAVIDLGM